jgi:hypothetical protein
MMQPPWLIGKPATERRPRQGQGSVIARGRLGEGWITQEWTPDNRCAVTGLR